MQDYRLYLTHAGHIQGVRELQASDDAAAIFQAEAARNAQPAELWNRARAVKVFEAGDGHAASDGSARSIASSL